MDKIGSFNNVNSNVYIGAKQKAPSIATKQEPEVVVEDKIQLTGEKNSSGIITITGDMRNTDFNKLDAVKHKIEESISQVIDNASKMDSVDRNLDSANNDLHRSETLILQAESDTDKTDVSDEGYNIENNLSSAKSELQSGKQDDEDAGYSMEKVKRDIDGRLTSPEQASSSQFVKKAIQDITRSQSSADKGDCEIDTAEKNISESLRNLDWGGMYITDISFDRDGKDVSSSAKQLSSTVDRAESNVGDAVRAVNNSALALDDLISLLNSAKQAVQSAQNALPKQS
jgi:hypothetical protein